MRNKIDSRHPTIPEPPCGRREKAVRELVFNDEEEALCTKEFVLSHQRQMPAIQEFLDEMSELDSHSSYHYSH